MIGAAGGLTSCVAPSLRKLIASYGARVEDA